jgi:hypothetical protein
MEECIMSKYIIEVDDNAIADGVYKIINSDVLLIAQNGLGSLQKYGKDENKDGTYQFLDKKAMKSFVRKMKKRYPDMELYVEEPSLRVIIFDIEKYIE